MDHQRVRELYESDEAAQAFFDHMSTRQRNQGETKVDSIVRVLKGEGYDVSRGRIITLFKNLQDLGCGQFVPGRHGWPSRFVWDVGLISVARVATGEEGEVEEITSEIPAEEEETDLLTHKFNLRPDLEVVFHLPLDLTEKEAQRLAGFITSLPMEEYD